jgi:cellulose 1,4-beta-cellobiosidase
MLTTNGGWLSILSKGIKTMTSFFRKTPLWVLPLALFAANALAAQAAAEIPMPARVNNPFAGAKAYVNTQWRAKVVKEPGGELIADNSTAIWLDRIATIAPKDGKTWGMADYLNDALAQNANLITFVLYDLPNRDCATHVSSGELLIAQNGLERYKKEYIDAIASIAGQPQYRKLRIVFLVEPDSLPNLVTNTEVPRCREAAGSGGYAAATQYTLDTLYPLRNVYSYVDIGHSGWLGWDENLDKTATLIGKVILGTKHGKDSVAGFISNTANYTPLEEPWLGAFEKSPLPGRNEQVRQAKFYEWNSHFGELNYARAFREKMLEQGFPSDIGMLIDTSRNGWGGAKRPSALSANADDVEKFVDESRIDRRTHRGMWCNQPGGIGERPAANPAPGIAAYIWAKPPGESDGISVDGIADPDDPAKKFDQICDPTAPAPGSGGKRTGALKGAPHAGQWFSSGFKVLLDNAWPALKKGSDAANITMRSQDAKNGKPL